jgi:hypothetical protein
VPVKAIFKGLPNIQKLCKTCSKNVLETLDHTFYECAKVKPVLNFLEIYFGRHGWPWPTYENIFYPDFNIGPDGQKAIADLGLYVTRASIWVGGQQAKDVRRIYTKNSEQALNQNVWGRGR